MEATVDAHAGSEPIWLRFDDRVYAQAPDGGKVPLAVLDWCTRDCPGSEGRHVHVDQLAAAIPDRRRFDWPPAAAKVWRDLTGQVAWSRMGAGPVTVRAAGRR
jgi:hypothetical protein